MEITTKIKGLFAGGETLTAYFLDRLASLGAERAVDGLQGIFSDSGSIGKMSPPGSFGARERLVAVRFSPGYCGWELSGQQALFRVLNPLEIGITLSESFLMEPIKSVSGVIVLAAPELLSSHGECAGRSSCTSQECRDREWNPDVEKE